MNSITDLLESNGGMDLAATPSGFVLGTVSENGNKKFPGMVKVQLTGWQDGKNITAWMPLLTGYAGKGYGSYLVPEVGDVVLVGFVGPMQEHPFVLGSFYPADATLPGKQFHKSNFTRHFSTKGGIDVTLSDEKNKQALTATTPKGLSVRLEDEKEIVTLTDKGGKNAVQLKCKDGAVSVKANKTVTVEAGGCKITLDANAGKISIKCKQLELEGTQSVKIKSASSTSVEGGMLKLEGKQQAQLKGGVMTEVSGGMLKLN